VNRWRTDLFVTQTPLDVLQPERRIMTSDDQDGRVEATVMPIADDDPQRAIVLALADIATLLRKLAGR
jgi:hypothetical protein